MLQIKNIIRSLTPTPSKHNNVMGKLNLDETVTSRLKRICELLYIGYRGELSSFNDTKLYHDTHRAIIMGTIDSVLLEKCNEYWEKYKNINSDTYIEMCKHVENECGSISYKWYKAFYELWTGETDMFDNNLYKEKLGEIICQIN